MLSDDEKREIDEQAQGLPERRGCSVEALKIVQKARGWISDDTLLEVARFLNMTADELDAVATFYPFIYRRPVGRHIIYLCDSMVCWAMGCESILERLTTCLKIPLGATTGDGRFTLLPVSCLGECDGAPAIIIDNDVYRNLDPDRIHSILERYT
jgi:NADH-quinone oxidoreductase subunit E